MDNNVSSLPTTMSTGVASELDGETGHPITKGFLETSVTVESLLGIVIFTGNVVVLLVTPGLQTIKRTSRYLIIHLGCSDIVVSIAVCIRNITIFNINSLSDQQVKQICLIVQSFVTFSAGNSITGILYVCIDSYLSVRASVGAVKPLTRGRTLFMIAACWLFWAVVSFLSLVITTSHMTSEKECQFGNDYFSSAYTVVITSTAIFLYFITAYFLLATLRFLKVKFNNGNRETQLAITDCSSVGDESHEGTRVTVSAAGSSRCVVTIAAGKKYDNLGHIRHVVRIAIVMLIAFGVCWLPILFVISVRALIHEDFERIVGTIQWMLELPAMLQSLMNVIIYYKKSFEFRRSVRQLFCRNPDVVSSPRNRNTVTRGRILSDGPVTVYQRRHVTRCSVEAGLVTIYNAGSCVIVRNLKAVAQHSSSVHDIEHSDASASDQGFDDQFQTLDIISEHDIDILSE